MSADRAARGCQIAGLSARELEVALLIARGLTKRGIASTLVITERTATNHVEHPLDKLGFRSGAQIAARATQQRLTNE